MIKLNVKRTSLTLCEGEALVEGNVNSISLKFAFSDDWDGLTRIAVFRNGQSRLAVTLEDDECAIPWEVLSGAGELYVSVRGFTDGGGYVLCTENELIGTVAASDAALVTDALPDATPDVLDALMTGLAELSERMDGMSGAHTPVKGTDYWTAADQAQIVTDVLEALPTWTGGDY